MIVKRLDGDNSRSRIFLPWISAAYKGHSRAQKLLHKAERNTSMNFNLTSLLFICCLVFLAALCIIRLSDLKRAYHLGVGIWSRWLPVCAIGIYTAILTINLISGSTLRSSMDLTPYFSIPEIAVFTALGPIFLSRLANLLASTTILYTLQRLLVGINANEVPIAIFLLLGSLTIVAILADKMPWLAASGPNPLAHRFREVLLKILSISALCVIFIAIINTKDISRWMSLALGFRLSKEIIVGLLAGLFLGWLTITVGYTRHFTLCLLSLPTVFILSILIYWPPFLILIPFTICIALSLATADRRLNARRKTIG